MARIFSKIAKGQKIILALKWNNATEELLSQVLEGEKHHLVKC